MTEFCTLSSAPWFCLLMMYCRDNSATAVSTTSFFGWTAQFPHMDTAQYPYQLFLKNFQAVCNLLLFQTMLICKHSYRINSHISRIIGSNGMHTLKAVKQFKYTKSIKNTVTNSLPSIITPQKGKSHFIQEALKCNVTNSWLMH